MKYLIVDAELGGSGVRSKYESEFIDLNQLGISDLLIQKICIWLIKYELEHYSGFEDRDIIDILDSEGQQIALMIQNELADSKVEYYSDAYARII